MFWQNTNRKKKSPQNNLTIRGVDPEIYIKKCNKKL